MSWGGPETGQEGRFDSSYFGRTGVVYAASLEWSDVAPGGGSIDGAAIVGGTYRGNGAVDVRRDAAALARLAAANGSFVRINGSWKDF